MNRDAMHVPDPFAGLEPEERDALLAAYALGELEGDERARVERLLADPAADEPRRLVAECRAVGEALRVAAAGDTPAPSAGLRRAVVTALAAAPKPRPSRRFVSAVLAVIGSLAAMLLVAVTFLPPAPNGRDVARRAAPPPTEASGRPTVGDDRLSRKRMDASARRAAASDTPPAASPAATGPAAPAASTPATEPVAVTEPAIPARARIRSNAAEPMTTPPAQGIDLADRKAPLASASGGRELAFQSQRSLIRLAEEGKEPRFDASAHRERYASFTENRFVAVADRPLSTFSIDVDTASYAVVRRYLAAGQLPPTDAVRIEEWVNYFRYSYPRPEGDDPFAVALEATECPWRRGHRLVRIGIAGRDVDRARRPAGNLVFLVDVSGSMDEPDKLPLVKQALGMLVEELTEHDHVAIVTYAGDAGLKLPPTSGDQKRRIRDVIEGLAAGGSTHGSAGIALAYEQAAAGFIPGGANRVILCTDGDLNVGITSDAALVDLVQAKARGGTFLTVLGFGRGNLQDAKLEALADRGNGVYAYVDGVREARKVLVEQLTGSTIAIAKDVKIQVEFNPAQVASYRLLGYENRALADADFRDDTKDAGEIGAGHTVTALYEIVPAGSAPGGDGPGAEPLKYQPGKPRAAEPEPAGRASRELLTVKLRSKRPEGTESVLREFPLVDHGGTFATATADTRFAAAVAACGMILRGSEFEGEATLPLVAQIATDALGPDEGGYRAEFLDLVRKAKALTRGHGR